MRDSILGNLSNLSVRLQELEVGWINKDELGLGSARLSLVNALEGFRSSRYRLGQKLSAYKVFFKAKQGWMAAAKTIADAIGCDERTIRRTIDDFERVSGVLVYPARCAQQWQQRSHRDDKPTGRGASHAFQMLMIRLCKPGAVQS